MKIFKSIFFILIAFMLGILNTVAQPPCPDCPPPPPGLPIDEHIFILMIIAILFGIYIIYSFKLKTKTPI